MALPTSFADLSQEELYRSAVADFAVDVEKDANEETIRAALLESGVTWADYVKWHPEVLPVEEPVQPVIGTQSMGKKDAATNVAVPSRPVVDEGQKFKADDSVLVKMTRENPYFEFAGYKFTQEQPFQIMDAETTNRILREEWGFSIARPDEAAEFFQY